MPRDSDEEVESSLEVPKYETQFVPQDDDEETLWEVIEILAEKGSRYRVRWAGNDPTTGQPWAPSWVPKKDCTDKLIQEWKVAQAKKKRVKEKKSDGKGRASTSSSRTSRTSKKSSVTPVVPTSRRTRLSSTAAVPGPSSNKAQASTSKVSSGSRLPVSHEEPLPLPPKKRALSRQASGEVEDGEDPEHPEARPRKKRRVTVEVVISPKTQGGIKIGPPRGVKQTEHASKESSTADSAEGSPKPKRPIKVGPPRVAKKKERPRKKSIPSKPSAIPDDEDPSRQPEQPAVTYEDADENDFLLHDNLAGQGDFWDFDLASRNEDSDHAPSREYVIPETQSLHVQTKDIPPTSNGRHSIPDAASPKTPVAPHTPRSSQRSMSMGSIVSKMKGRNPAKRTKTKCRPKEEESGSSNERVQAKRGLKPLRPVPVLSPSVFYDHLPQPDPPPSSIEQFSSPEKGSEAATAAVRRKIQKGINGRGKYQAVASKKDDETLRIRGQQLAEQASSARRTRTPQDEDQSYLFEPGLSPEPPSLEEQIHPEIQTADLSNSLHPTDESEPLIDEHDMFETYVDLNGGVEHDSGDPVAEGQPDVALSLGPDLPGRKRVSPFNSVHRAKHQRRTVKHVHLPDSEVGHTEGDAPLNEAQSAFENISPMSSVQQVDVDSQSQRALLEHQVGDLTAALGAKSGEISDLEKRLSKLQLQVDQLKDDNASLHMEGKALSELQLQIAELKGENAGLLERCDEIAALQQELAQAKADNANLLARNERLPELQTHIAQLQAENLTLCANDKRYSELQTQFTRLEAENATLRATIQELSELQPLITSLKTENAILVKKVEASQRAKADAEELRDLFQKQYNMASSYTSDVDAKNKELELELNISKSQVLDGLAMVKGLYIEQIKKLQEELDKWKGRSKIVMEKDERTNDKIRRQAALEPQLREENEQLKIALEKAKASCRDVQEALRQLSHDAASPNYAPGVDSGDTSLENDDEDLPLRGPEVAKSYTESFVQTEDGQHGHSPSQVLSSQRSESFLYSGFNGFDNVYHVCQYVTDGAMCNARLGSAEEVRKHAYLTHYSRLQEFIDL
ncbi:hypothetical protein BKA93DRAFT_821209 [Sparassis latifolia]